MTGRTQTVRDELAKTIGTHARAARIQRKLTQADVAERIGIGSQVYGRLERGVMRPSIETLRKLAQVLGISADEMLGVRKAAEGFVQMVPTCEEPPAFRLLLRRVRKLEPSSLRLLTKLVGAVQRTGAR